MKKPVVVGDSHANLSFSKDKFIFIKGFDGKTAFMLDRPNRFKKLKDKCTAYKGHVIYFIFGEIDCRMHILQKNSLQKTIDKYFKVINQIRNQGNDVWIVSIPPPGRNPPADIHCGSFEERKEIVKKFNKLLSRDEKFVNIYDGLITENGNRRPECTLDTIHCNEKLGDIVYNHFLSKQMSENVV